MRLDKNMITVIILNLAAAILTGAQSIVTTGLTEIMYEFSIPSTTAQWLYSAFLLVVAVMVPLSAFLTRRFKLKTILISSLVLFLIGSVVDFVAPNIIVMIIGRIIQAAGAGIIIPISQIVIFKVFPEEQWQTYMGIFGFIIGVAPALAPTIGGYIIDLAGWRTIFLIFAVIIAILTAISFAVVKLEFETEPYPLDISSLILCVVGCVGIMFGFTNIAQNGFDLIWVILPIVIGVISMIIFIRRQFNIETPLVDLNPLKNKYFFLGTLFTSLIFFTMCGINVIMPLFAQSVSYYDATTSGLILLPATLMLVVFNLISPVLTNRFGVQKVLIAASVLTVAGFLLMIPYNQTTPIEYMIVTQIIRTIGAGLGLMASTTWTIAIVSGDVEDATAINSTVRQISAAIGSALAVVLMATFAGGNIGHDLASVHGFSLTALFMAILGVICVIIAIVYLKDDIHDLM